MNPNNFIRWKRFARKAYAAFCSMHKVVTVGVLSVAMLQSSDAKANKQHKDSVLTVEQEATLETIEVTTEDVSSSASQEGQPITSLRKTEINCTAHQSVNDLLKNVPTIDVRQRGSYGIQTDISIRGNSSDNTTILLNGINISSPHTGHLSADFPIPTDAISKIEISNDNTGSSGTINILTTPDTSIIANLSLSIGLYSTIDGSAVLNLKNKTSSHLISFTTNKSDGAVVNSEFNQKKLFYLGNTNIHKTFLEWQAGYSGKQFDANTFYSAAYNNQWEETDRIITSIRMATKTLLKFETGLGWIRSFDHFKLIKDSTFGENYHRTDVLTATPELSYNWLIGKSYIGAEVRYENIYSTNLGIPMKNDSVKIPKSGGEYYKKQKDRTIINANIGHNLIFRRWNLNMGTRVYRNYDEEGKAQLLPYLNSKIKANKHWTLFLSWDNCYRTPTFTELFYKSPTSEGNINLKAETSSITNLTIRYRNKGLNSEVSSYYIHGKKMIDWVMFTDNDSYHSTNFKLDNIGFEINNTIYFDELAKCFPIQLYMGYHFIHQERHDKTHIFKSLYALEYLKHKFVARIKTKPLKKLELQLGYRLISRNGGYITYNTETKTNIQTGYDPYGILDIKAIYNIHKLSIFCEGDNLLNTEYYDIGNVPQPKFTGRIGLNYKY